ncbi:MAG: hypothetical protein JSS75_04400 [Bacteroidetes bacterium]|nr:hypothetical protein [Bacteroidota bacterium]
MESREIVQQLDNPWHKSYWFARMLISGDKYGGVAKDNRLLLRIGSAMRVLESGPIAPTEKLALQKAAIGNILEERFSRSEAKLKLVRRLHADLSEEIQTVEDMRVFVLTCESIIIPINQAIANIPSDDRAFTQTIAQSFLKVQGDAGLATVIRLWDDLGVKGCLTAERTEIVKAFAALRLLLEKDTISVEERDIVLTAFVQEFERRAGQKRKGRAGGSLEDVTSFILDYYGIPSASQPEHFQADIEVDKWVKTRDSWLIGISCKRTLRERWKQVTSADRGTLGRYKIKQIYHIITYDEDLSDEKLALLGSLSHIVYLPNDSSRLSHAEQHIGLKQYVRPISEFINDLRQQL